MCWRVWSRVKTKTKRVWRAGNAGNAGIRAHASLEVLYLAFNATHLPYSNDLKEVQIGSIAVSNLIKANLIL